MSTPTRNPTPANSSTSGTTSRKAKTIVWVVLAAVVVLTNLLVYGWLLWRLRHR